ARGQPDGFERHRDDVSDMPLAVEREGPPLIGAAMTAPIVGAGRLVCRMVGTSKLVVLGFANPPEAHPQPPPKADRFAFEAAGQVLVEQLVVTDFIRRDI